MTVMVALLRGINVGGRGKLAMADLRAAAEECGHEQVRTYVQSGNVVFRSAESDADVVGRGLRTAIAEATGLDVEVVVRTRDELAAVVTTNPFRDRSDDPTRLHVTFFADEHVPADALDGVDVAARAPEEAAAVGRELYLHLPEGIGRSKLAADLARRQGARGTTRNWRSVTKLLELADATT